MSGRRVDRRELDEATSHGQLYVDRLRAAHLTLSGVALVAFGGLVGALPLVALAWTGIASRSVAGVPLAVLLLLAPFPAVVVIGAVYARRADGLDDAFSALLEDDAPGLGDDRGVPAAGGIPAPGGAPVPDGGDGDGAGP